MKRFIKILLSLSSLRKALGFGAYFAGIKENFHIELILKPNFTGKNVLVLSPHPDDDIFGLGGTLAQITKTTAVTVAYFCDGSGGIVETKNQRGNRDKDLISIRRKEVEEAGKILGVKEQVFFGYPDGKLASGENAHRALTDLIKRVKPDIIFIPSFLDNHPDHRAANEILINTLSSKEIATEKIMIWAYEVWTPIWPNRIVNITSAVETKKQAITAQKSQLEARNYGEAILGLNQYRAEMNNFAGFAEGFFASTPEIYKKLYRES